MPNTVKEMMERRGEIVNRMRDMIGPKAAPNDLSDDEIKEFDRIDRESVALEREIEMKEPAGDPMVGRRDTHPLSARSQDGGDDNGSPGDRSDAGDDAALEQYRDADDRPVPVFSRGQSVARHVSRDGDSELRDVSVGGLLVSAITGKGSEAERRAMSIGSQVGGGFLLTGEMSATVIDLARKQSRIFQAGAKTVLMQESTLKMAKVATDPTGSWTAENSQITSSEVTVASIEFRAKKLGALVKLSRELVDDAPNARRMVEEQLAKVLALEIDRVALLGDGGGEEPRGIFNHSDVQELGSVGSPTYDDFIDAIQLVEDVDGVPNAYMYSPDTRNTLEKAKDGQGQYLAAPPVLAVLPPFVTRQLATTQAVLGDFEQIMVGVRRHIRVEITTSASDGTQSAFDRDQVWIKATWRGDVQLGHANHLVKLTGIT